MAFGRGVKWRTRHAGVGVGVTHRCRAVSLIVPMSAARATYHFTLTGGAMMPLDLGNRNIPCSGRWGVDRRETLYL